MYFLKKCSFLQLAQSLCSASRGTNSNTVATNGFCLPSTSSNALNARCPHRHSPRIPRVLLCLSQQADERYRKNVQGSPQSAQTKPQQPPVPPRSESSYPNGNSASEAPAMHRPVEPQVNVATSLVRRGAPPPLARRRMASFCTKTLKPNVLRQITFVSVDMTK